MAEFYCRVCMVRKVARDGDVCPNCEDPYQSAAPAAQPVQTGHVQRQAQNTQPAKAEDEYVAGSTMARSRGRNILNTPARDAQTQTHAKRIVYQQPVAPQQEPPTYVKADPTIVVPVGNTKPQQNTAPKGKNAPQCEGIVRNIQESKDNSSAFERWMRAFSTGTPFALTDDMIEFQVFSGWNSGSNSATGYAADKVIVYGTINSGKPVQDNSVRVYGTRDKGNAIIASAIENTTDGTFAQFKPDPLPAGMVKVITLLVLCLIAFAVYFLFSLGSGLGGLNINMDGVTNFLVCLVLLVGSAVWILQLIRKLFMGMRTGNVDLVSTFVMMLIALAVLVSALENMF